jgi:hypothetical protein
MDDSPIEPTVNRRTYRAELYGRQKKLVLAQELRSQTKIYLDTKYWLLLRDARAGRTVHASLPELLARLQSLVQQRHAVCPLNADIFIEVIKQSDRATRNATIQLMDELSRGVTIMPMSERMSLELFHFLESCRVGDNGVEPLSNLIWSKARFILGFAVPLIDGLSPDQEFEAQKQIIDRIWDQTLIDAIGNIPDDEFPDQNAAFPDISGQLNTGKAESINEHKTFESMFLAEVAGGWDSFRSECSHVFRSFYQRATHSPADDPAVIDAVGRALVSVIVQAFKHGKVGKHLPSTRVSAGLHAALRWDRGRKYMANDLFDFRHAEAAIAYCDLFFTERSLCHLLKDRNLRLSDFSGCQVYFDPSDALRAVESISGRQLP